VAQAIAAGVKCVDHGQLLDDATAKLMAEKGIWWSMQPFTQGDVPSTFEPGSDRWLKQRTVFAGTDNAYKFARQHKVKLAWGTDILYSAENLRAQNRQMTKMVKWFTVPETLRMVTHDNAALLALSGPRNPYPGKLGAIEVGALADILLVDGDPLANIDLLADPGKSLLIIMKDGKVYKNIMPK
jgi:imidazolonepropionase-like amidohydrolase